MAQPRVPLPQGFLQALPGAQKAMFHVEHTPVEELPTNLRRTFQQAKTIRIDQLQRQQIGELCSASCILPVDADLQFTLTITRNTQVAGAALGQLHLTENGTSRLLVMNHWLQASAAEGASEAKQMDRFQHAGLAAAVGAVEDVDARGGGEGHRVQVTHRGDRDTAQ